MGRAFQDMGSALEAFRTMYSARWYADRSSPTAHLANEDRREAHGCLAIMEFMRQYPDHVVDGREGPHYSNEQIFYDAANGFINAVARWDRKMDERFIDAIARLDRKILESQGRPAATS